MSDTSKFSKDKTLFGMEKNPSHILPAKYTLDSRIKFKCYPGISCFTQCCGNITIVLTPYDILRLRQRLGLAAHDFLHQYTLPTYLEKTDMPGVHIKLAEDGRCPFVTAAGCTVYSDRPSACRYYPVGMANFHEGAQENQAAEQFFFVVKEPHCQGFAEEKEWTVGEWRADQGVDVRDEMNRGWMELVMRRKSFGLQATLSEPAKRMFFMASTDLDQFRAFIFNSSFLDTYEVEAETRELLKLDDVELLKFSFRYLASTLFGTQDIKIRPEKIRAKAETIKKDQTQAVKDMEQRAAAEIREIQAERERLKKAKVS